MTQIPVQGGRTIDLQRHVALQQKLRRGDPNIGKKDLERFRTRYKYSEDEKSKKYSFRSLISESSLTVPVP